MQVPILPADAKYAFIIAEATGIYLDRIGGINFDLFYIFHAVVATLFREERALTNSVRTASASNVHRHRDGPVHFAKISESSEEGGRAASRKKPGA
jgi:hypothetical protein